MSLNTKPLCKAALSLSRRHANAASIRRKSNQAYPFTKPSSNSSMPRVTTADTAAKVAYPFTKPSAPTKIASPTNPVERPGPSQDDSAVISREAQDDSDAHRPDYIHGADYRTSSFSPVPMRVMDGSEDIDVTPAAVLSGAPTELQARTVRIYQPAKTATQSGSWHSHHWQMDWDVLGKGHRWENPLMGWQSSGDMMQGTKLNFVSKDDAIRFAQKQGYEFFVQEPNSRKIVPKAYANQFLYSGKELKQARTK